MTTEIVAQHIHRTLPELFEGYLALGFHAATNEPVFCLHAPSAEAAENINAVLREIVRRGGVKFESGREESVEARL